MNKPTDAEIDAAWRESVAKHERTTAFVRDFARAVLAKRGTPAPVEPVAVVVPCYTPSGKRVALYSAKQDLPIGTQLYTAPQPSPAVQGDALSDDAVRVPLDSLHADAAYLIGRLREGSMPYARVIEIIRERIDAAKAAIRARAAQGDVLDAAFEAVRKRLCKLPRYSFALDSRSNLRRCEDKSGNWIEFDAVHALFDPVAIDAARAAQGGK